MSWDMIQVGKKSKSSEKKIRDPGLSKHLDDMRKIHKKQIKQITMCSPSSENGE